MSCNKSKLNFPFYHFYLSFLFITCFCFVNGCTGGGGNEGDGTGQNVGVRNFAYRSCSAPLECQDGIWCNGMEYCGCIGDECRICIPGIPPNCDDNDPCTVDRCVNTYIGTPGAPGVEGEIGEGHCEHLRICRSCRDDYDCEDNDSCTVDSCIDRICHNDPINCDDDNFCTVDSCDPDIGCQHEPIPDCCRTDEDCNDSNPCTIDSCNTVTHSCVYSPNTGAPCEYDDECYSPGVCLSNGLCGPGDLNAPLNNECDGAVEITLSDIGEACAEGSTQCAEDNYSGTCGGGTNPDVVYKFSFSVGDEFQLYAYDVTLDADFDTILYARTGCENVSSEVNCNDNCSSGSLVDCFMYGLGSLDSAFKIMPYPVGISKILYLFVDGRGGGWGNYALEIHKVAHDNNPCYYSSDNKRRVDATYGGEYRGNINGYINDLIRTEEWDYEREIRLRPSTPVDNYQVMIVFTPSNFNYSHVQADGRDIRFFDLAGNRLSYWIEQWNPGGTSIVWVKVLASGTDRIIMKYGNDSVSSASSGYATFNFFDDFDGSSLSPKWRNDATSYGISGSVLRINVGAVGLSAPLSFNLQDGYIVEARIMYHTTSGGYSGTLSAQSSRYTAGSNSRADATSLYMRCNASARVCRWTGSGATARYDCGASGVWWSSNNRWYIIGAKFYTGGVTLTWDSRASSASYGCGWRKNLKYISLGAFYGGSTYNIQDTSYDWVLVRRYAADEPVASIGAERPSGTVYVWLKTPCHTTAEGASSDWPAHAWFILRPSITATYCIWTDEGAPAQWFDTVISVWDNTLPTGCNGTKRYLTCAHLDGRNGGINATKMEIVVPGGSTYMVGISSYSRPVSGNYSVHFDLGRCDESCEESGGVVFRDSCYVLFNTPKLWDEARDSCIYWGGHLVTISDAEENEFVRANFAAVVGDSPWIGFNDVETEGDWVWVTGEPVTYTNWNTGEPNDAGGNEDWGQMYSNGRWNDCGPSCGPRSYICEKP